ncbi:ArfGap-domain-containing protein [Meredithblackwellia eburnea MCA 4105]
MSRDAVTPVPAAPHSPLQDQLDPHCSSEPTSSPPPSSSPPAATPIFEQFHKTDAIIPKSPTKVSAIPRKGSQASMTGTGTADHPTPAGAAAAVAVPFPITPTRLENSSNGSNTEEERTPIASSSTARTSPPRAPQTPVAPPEPNVSKTLVSKAQTTDLDDGPLFRAIASSLLKRAVSLKTSEKRIVKQGEQSLSALQAHSLAQSAMDEELENLSISSATASSQVLGGMWQVSLRAERERARRRRVQDKDQLEELVERMRGGIERLRTLESRRKNFESESKRYYDDLSKYLSRTDLDGTKASTLDAKQAARTASFHASRLEYFAALESIVESEEAAVASWLRTWAGVPEDVGNSSLTEEARKASREEQRHTVARSLGMSVAASLAAAQNGEAGFSSGGAEAGVSDVEGGVMSDDGASGGSAISQKSQDLAAQKRRRRASVQGLGFGLEKEGGTRDRIKGFIKTQLSSAQNSFQPSRSNPIGSRHSHSQSVSWDNSPSSPLLGAPPSPTIPPPASVPVLPPISTSTATLSVPPSAVKLPSHSSGRKKEGFLWATARPTGHTTAGDGGGQWHKFWTVLSEGQLIEFANWKTSLSVRNAPINLRYATAKISRNTDRRFCFEVITPSSRRIYQTVSDEDVKEWVTAISRSIESLLNGTSSVRHFDASRLTGSSVPYSLSDFGSNVHLPRESSSPVTLPHSPSGGLSQISNKIPSWPLGRRTSLGGHLRKKDKDDSKRSSMTPLGPPALIIRAASTEIQRGDRQSAGSEGSAMSPTLEDRLGRGWTAGFMKSGRRSPSGSSDGGLGESDRSDGASDQASLCEEDKTLLSGIDEMIGPVKTQNEVANSKVRNAARLEELVELPENSSCADCHDSEPRWASWSLGIFICIRCSGHHRSLGTHVSKVRSLDLDDWSDEQLAVMERWGNAKANGYWENRKPPGVAPSDANIASYIRRKYVDQEWVPSAPKGVERPQLSPIVEKPAGITA